jgi:hypothetical protein
MKAILMIKVLNLSKIKELKGKRYFYRIKINPVIAIQIQAKNKKIKRKVIKLSEVLINRIKGSK